jgi:ATP-dependent 26S proteasome regulatory subunit
LTDEIELVREKPLIVAFDEVDVALLRIHESTIPDHKNVPTLIQDKTGWNRFLDNFQRGLFPYLILLMTSNRSPDFISSLDPSYLRKGRVDGIFELATKTD